MIGSLTKGARKIIIAGGLLTLLSAIVFAAGLQIELWKSTPSAPYISEIWWTNGVQQAGLFWDAQFIPGYTVSYLSFGFWFALIAGIMMFIASRTNRETVVPEHVPPPPA